MFLGRSSAGRSIANRRNLFILMAAMLPYLFFTLSGTKFAHYIMPVLPLFIVMLAACLAWLGREPAALEVVVGDAVRGHDRQFQIVLLVVHLSQTEV